MATIAVYSLKGGVGKTTLAVNLAWSSATRSARRTLLWDLDAQAASTYLLGGGARPTDKAQAIFTKDVAPSKLIQSTAYDRLDILPADASLRSLDHVFHELDKKKRLAKLLSDLAKAYDRVILDCPPGLTDTSEQVMRAASVIVVPVIPSPLSVRAYEEVATQLAKRDGKVAMLPVHSMVDRRRKLHAEAIERSPDWPVIPMASMIETMAARREPVAAFAPRSAAAQSFSGLWQTIEHRLSKKH